MIENYDDDDEPVRKPDPKRSRVNQDYPPMPDHLLTSDDEDIGPLIVKALVDAGVAEKRARAQTNMFTNNDGTSLMEMYGRGGIMNEANGPSQVSQRQMPGALDIRTLKPNGDYWDLTKRADRRKARELVNQLDSRR